MSNAAIESAWSKPVVTITTPATIAAADPKASARTSRNAPRMFREPSRRDASRTIETRLATRPMTAKTSIWSASTATGSSSLATPA